VVAVLAQLVVYPGGVHSNASTGFRLCPPGLVDGCREKRLHVALFDYIDTIPIQQRSSAQTGAPFCAPAIFELFGTLRTMTTTLDELNDDEPGNADAPPHTTTGS
jgi:hypothetical protein